MCGRIAAKGRALAAGQRVAVKRGTEESVIRRPPARWQRRVQGGAAQASRSAGCSSVNKPTVSANQRRRYRQRCLSTLPQAGSGSPIITNGRIYRWQVRQRQCRQNRVQAVRGNARNQRVNQYMVINNEPEQRQVNAKPRNERGGGTEQANGV